MPKVVVRLFACSLDGFGAGLHQTQSEPFGKNAMQIMDWFKSTRTFKAMIGGEGGSTGLDDSYASRALEGVGASIMGRNMFSPLRGPWANEDWKGWWGDNPPYKHPVFVLTHHPRPTLEFANGTSFHFVDGSPEQVLEQARAAAGDKDVKVNGGDRHRPCLLESQAARRTAPGDGSGIRGGRRAAPGRAGGGGGLPGGRLRGFRSGRALQDRQETLGLCHQQFFDDDDGEDRRRGDRGRAGVKADPLANPLTDGDSK